MSGKIIFVFGTHSSGTSCVAGVLHHLGVNMGDRFSGVYGNDPEGSCSFEAIQLAWICEQSLPLGATEIQTPVSLLEDRLSRWIAERKKKWEQGSPAIGGKYPQLCAFTKILERICGESLYAVFVDRPLEYSLKSIVSRPDVRTDRAAVIEHMKWLHHEKEQFRRRLPSSRAITIEYELLIQEPRREIRRLIDFVGMDVEDMSVEKALRHVRPTMKHY